MRKLLPLFACCLLLSGCGLKPLYSGGTQSSVSQALGQVEIPAIQGRSGWLVRNALRDRLQPMADQGAARYRLVIALDDVIEGLGVRADDTISRERRTLRARYQLIDLATGRTVLDATAGSDAGIDVTSSEYATIAAENTALENLAQEVADQIVARLALTLRAKP